MSGDLTNTMEKDLRAFLIELEVDLIKSYNQKKIKASGRWGKELESVVKGTSFGYSGLIKGADYSKYIEFGRPPSSKLPPVNKIEQWIEEKGISIPAKYKTVNSFAWAIAFSIKHKGTTWWRKGGSNMIGSVITKKRINRFISDLGIDMENVTFVALTKEFIKI